MVVRTSNVSPAGRVFYIASVTTALIVGGLQALRVRGGFVTNYGADIFGTAWLYAIFRQGRVLFQRGRFLSPSATSAIVMAGCVGSEFGQKLRWVPGTFDWLDIAAYVATVLACYVCDTRVKPLA